MCCLQMIATSRTNNLENIVSYINKIHKWLWCTNKLIISSLTSGIKVDLTYCVRFLYIMIYPGKNILIITETVHSFVSNI